MRNLWIVEINQNRFKHPMLGVGDETCGSFLIPSPIDASDMIVIASQGGGWDHVSVSRKKRPPNWPEMEHVKRLFFGDEVVVQFHVPSRDHVNNHPNCLHLWRPQEVEIPRPPAWMVCAKDGQTIEQALAEGDVALSVSAG